MLTPIQIEKLRTLVTSQKYGKLLEDAIDTWSTEGSVLFNDFGLIFNSETNRYNLHKNKKCCLIGAALQGKETTDFENIEHSADRVFNIPYNDIIKIWQGFDCNNDNINLLEKSESFIFGYSVRQILLENSEEDFRQHSENNSENKI